MRFILLGFLCCVIFSCSITKSDQQQVEIDRDYFIEGQNISNFGVDAVGNIFFTENERVVKKFSKEGTLINTFDEQSGGFIHSMDVKNPLYILLYYRDGGVIKILDRNLALLNDINFTDWTQDDITAAQLSNDNHIWLYNNTKRKVQKYTISGKLIFESLDLYGITSWNTSIEKIYEHQNFVFLINEEQNIQVLDNLGRFKYDLGYQFGTPIYGRKNQICGPFGDKYSCYNLTNTIQEKPIPLENLDKDSKESLLFNFFYFEVFDNGITRTPIIF